MAYDSSPMGRPDPGLTDPMGHSRPPATEHSAGFTGAFASQSGFAHGMGTPSPASPSAEDPFAVDEEPGESDEDTGRDHLAVHWIWETVLVLGVAVLAVLVWQAQPDMLRGDRLSELMVTITGYLLLGLAAGMTLRTAAPNLAIGPVAAAAAVHFAERGSDGVIAPTIVAVLAAIVAGLVLTLLVVGLQVPAWAASLALAAGAVVWLQQQAAQVPLSGQFDPTGHAVMLFAVVAVVAVVGGLLGALATVRRAISRTRATADAAARPGPLASVLTSLALVTSMVLAALAGVLLAAGQGTPVSGSSGLTWLEWTLIGFAVALVAGTSAFGRRGGVFGVVLVGVLLALFDVYQRLQGWHIALLATAATAVAAGLVVTRVVERFGGPAPDDLDDWSDDPPAIPARASAVDDGPDGAGSWAAPLPAKPVTEQPTTWDAGWGR